MPDDRAWAAALDELQPSIHEVDRFATRVWFRFFPLSLAGAVAGAADIGALERAWRLEGRYRLNDQADSSHWFLYGHRYWEAVKALLLRAGAPEPSVVDLAATVRDLARDVAAVTGVDPSLLTGISSVGVMTLQQVGREGLRRSMSAGQPPLGHSPEDICAARQKDDPRSLLAIVRGGRRRYSVRFDERRPDGRFAIVDQQHLTTAAAADTRRYTYDRGYSQEGPIPAQCRSGSCGTCWVGVLGGAEKLSDVERLEARRLQECGYFDAAEGRPFIRLACMARASGNVTIVIPPWNGFLMTNSVG